MHYRRRHLYSREGASPVPLSMDTLGFLPTGGKLRHEVEVEVEVPVPAPGMLPGVPLRGWEILLQFCRQLLPEDEDIFAVSTVYCITYGTTRRHHEIL